MIIWRVEFEYRIEGVESAVQWRPDAAHHLGDEDGSAAVNYVCDAMIGSEVEIVTTPFMGTPTTATAKIVEWRLTGVTRVGKLNFVDVSTLIAAGIVEATNQESTAPTDAATPKARPMPEFGQGTCMGHCEHCVSGEGETGIRVPDVVGPELQA